MSRGVVQLSSLTVVALMADQMPALAKGRSIGLLGGSFDPAHSGHAHITLSALKRFALDEVWWLISPGNPLKTKSPASLEKRIATAKNVMDHPRVRITSLEQELGTQYTADTIAALQNRFRGAHFVWLMGADNLATFHTWDRWEDIVSMVPIGVLARPGDRQRALHSRMARQYRFGRIPASDAAALARAEAPAWCFLNTPMQHVSSSAIRAAGKWEK